MPKKIDHIAIAVRSLAEGEALLNALGFTCERQELIEEQGVRVAFFDVAGVHVELLEPLSAEGPIRRFLGDRLAVVHHLAFASNDIEAEMAALQAKGMRFIDPEPRNGSRGKRIAFIHPKSSASLLIELCQDVAVEQPKVVAPEIT
ncbi:MAG TPA: methylmalonyl-CoA epimerase [Verrucomicrobiota bacterium]|nr:methylmalonyl-CoA epimerase [Verrucomicrobiales bacterium]HRI11752.1 methylmalonyl-CoA epimerase [Verrucomicrobiota bacterium]